MGEAELEDLCRLCLTKIFTLKNIFSTHSPSGELVSRTLQFVYDLKISEGDGLPSLICSPCLWRMVEFDEFKKNVHHAEGEIMKILNRSRADANEISCNEEDNDGNAVTEEIRLENVGEAQEVESDKAADDIEVSIKEEIDIVENKVSDDILRRENVLELKEEDGWRNQEADEVLVSYEGESEILEIPCDILSGENSMEMSSLCPMELNEDDTQGNQEADEVQPSYGMEVNISQCLAGNETTGEDIFKAECSSIVNTQQEQEFLGAKEQNTGSKSIFICDVCGKSFSRKFNFARHSTSHTNERPYSCSKCGKRYKSQVVRRLHELRHKRDLQYKGCNRKGSLQNPSSGSGKPSSSKGNKSIGCVNKSRKYACSICEKSFVSSFNLNKHMLRHTNEKSFTCKVCHKSFKWSSTLMYHLYTHSSKKPFTCNICQKSFKWDTSLRSHLFTHSSKKGFPCSFCEKKFKTRDSKSQHELIHFSKS